MNNKLTTFRRLPGVLRAAGLLFLFVLFGEESFADSYRYDNNGRLTQVIWSDGRQVSYRYDKAGNLLEIATSNDTGPAVIITTVVRETLNNPIADYAIQTDRPGEVVGYAVKKLPKGLKANLGTTPNEDGKPGGTIYGTPLKPGSFAVQIAAKGAGGTAPSATLVIEIENPFDGNGPLEPDLDGKYSVTFAPSSISGMEGGAMLSVTLNSQGAFSGTLVTPVGKYRIKGVINPTSGVGALITINRKAPHGALDLELSLALSGSDRGLLAGTLGDGIATTNGEGWGTSWDAPGFLAQYVEGKKTGYSVVLEPQAAGIAYPQGDGFVILTLDNTRRAKLKGELPDGSRFSASSYLTPEGEVALFLTPYREGGYASGNLDVSTGYDPVEVSDNVVTGNLDWRRPVASKPSETVYPDGFFTIISSLGAPWEPPAKGERLFNLGSDLDHVLMQIELVEGGLSTNLVETIAISTKDKIEIVGENLNKVSIQVSRKSGVISGSFYTSDPLPLRKAKFRGIALPSAATETGGPGTAFGYFLLPTSSGELKLSGQAWIGPSP